jgi:hypothetical protein
MTWYILLDAKPQDILQVKRLFSASGFVYDEIDQRLALNAPAFGVARDKDEIIDLAMELAASINTAMRLSVNQYSGLMFAGLVEKRDDGSLHRTMFAEGAAFGIAGAGAVALAGSFGPPVRTREERLVSLVVKNSGVADLAVGLTPYPLTWGAMRKTYESVVGLMSTKEDISKRRGDYEGLIARGWLTKEESQTFYHNAAYHTHGYPKTPVRGGALMDHTTAQILIKRLFWRMVDELEPK